MSLINFLLDVKSSKVQVFCELVQLNQKSNLSLRERALLYEIYIKAQLKFDTLTLSKAQQHSENHYKEQLLQGQVFEKSKGSSKKSFASVEQKDYLSGIKFDENLNELEKLYLDTLMQKEHLIKMLCNDLIDLTEFKDKSIIYYKSRQQLLQSLKRLSRVHFGSQKLQFYMDRYVQIMSFGQRKKDLFRYNKKNKNIESNDDNETENLLPQLYRKVDQRIFDQDNCVVFITLIDKIGEIKRSQSKFESIFGYSLKEAIGNNIQIILPNLIATHHNKLLEDFVNEQSQLKDISFDSQLSKIKPLLLAKNNEGWAVPVSLAFKIDNIGLDECGLSAHLTRLKNDSAFIMTASQTFQVQLMSEVLYKRLLGRFVGNQNDLRKIHLNRLIPFLHYFEKKWMKDKNDKESNFHKEFVKTIAFLPRQDVNIDSLNINSSKKKRQFLFDSLDFSKLESELSNYSIEYLDIYSIQMKFVYTSNKYFSYNLIELASLRKVIDKQEIQECLSSFSNMMKTFLDIKYNPEKELQLLDTFSMSLKPSQNSLQKEAAARNPKKLKFNIHQQGQQEFIKSFEESNKDQEIDQSQLQFGRDEFNDETFNKDKDQPVFLDLQRQNQDQKDMRDLTSQQLQSSRLDIGENNFNQSMNSNTQLFEISQQGETNRLKNNLSYLLDNSAIPKQHKNNQIHKLSHQQQHHLKYHNATHNTDSRDFDSSLFDKLEELNHHNQQMNKYQYSQRDQLNNSEHQLTLNTQALQSTTDRFYEGGVQNQSYAANDSGKIEKMLLKNQSSTLDFQSNQSYSQQNSINNMIGNLNQKLHDISKYQVDNNQPLKVKQIGVNKKIEEQSETTFSRKQSDTVKTLNSRAFDKQGSKMKTILKRNRELEEQQRLNIKNLDDDFEDYEGEDILRKRQTHHLGIGSFSTSNENDYENEAMRKSRIVAASSIHTTKSHNFEQKRFLKAQISSKKKNLFMTILTLFGFCSMAVVVALTLYQYFNILNQFSVAQKSFEFLPYPMSFRSNLVLALQQDAILTMIKSNVFPGITDNNYFNTSLATLSSSIKGLSSLFDQYQRADFTQMTFFNYLVENNMDFLTSIDDRLSTNPQTNNESEKNHRSIQIAYVMQQITGYLYDFMINIQNTLYVQKIIIDNFPTFNTHLVNLQTLISQYTTDIINSIQNQVLILLILVIVLAILLISAIFPIYYFVQVQNENLLKLFATLQPEHIKAMLFPIQLALSEDKSNKYKFISETFKKRKAISNTSVLPKFKPIFLLFSLLSFISLIIQPITNYILISQFRDETFLNIDLLINLYGLKANFISSVAVFYQLIPQYMNLGVEVYNVNYYKVRINSLITQNQSQLNTMYTTLSTSQATSRYEESYYNNFLYKIVQGNMCQAFQQYPQFISSDNAVDYDTCETVENGILQKGFQFCVKSFLTTFVNLSQIIADPTNFVKNILQWESENKTQQFNKFFNILYSTINIMKDFMLQMLRDQINFMIQISTILLFFQLFALLFVFLVGWVKFYTYIIDEMYQIKNLISILSIEVVIENPYMFSYLNQ